MKSFVLAADLESSLSIGLPSQDENLFVTLHDADEFPVSIAQHPLGVKPLGNQYTASCNAREFMGSFQILPDETLIVLLEYLGGSSLRLLGSTCKALFAFTRSEDLWKTLFIERSSITKSRHFKWRGSWRSTFLSLTSDKEIQQISCDSLYSDVLYRPFQCANTPLHPYYANIPGRNAISRLSNLTPEDFSSKWSETPFILTEPVREWPVSKTWDTDKLLDNFSDVEFRAEAVDWPLKTYIEYMSNNSDESPLYLFDRSFVEKMGLLVGRKELKPSYWIPDCFGEDLFTALGDQRPDSRWLIIGPERSGSTFHKDPNATSAWNAVLRGSKYWIMFPTGSNSSPPPGVFVSDDQSEVTSPLSIAEWLLGFHTEARRTPGCLEGICREGEVLHVPSGWWHLVVNLDASIAITQNFVPRSHLPSVLSFLKDKSEQISGFKKEVTNPYDTFLARMKVEHPDLLSSALVEVEKKAEAKKKKRKWEKVVGESEGNTFNFAFGEEGDSDEGIP